jgi:hypothetical protein
MLAMHFGNYFSTSATVNGLSMKNQCESNRTLRYFPCEKYRIDRAAELYGKPMCRREHHRTSKK